MKSIPEAGDDDVARLDAPGNHRRRISADGRTHAVRRASGLPIIVQARRIANAIFMVFPTRVADGLMAGITSRLRGTT
ncbi:MAG: hypothetical protein WC995_06540 [Lysobacteraceae bacterium]